MRVKNGRLHPIHRGVYAVGHPAVTDRGRWLAAVLALGDEAFLSHRAAGTLLGFLPQSRSDRQPPTDVTVPRRLKPRPGIRPHTARALNPRTDATRRHGIPVTTAARALLDLSATMHPEALERAMNEALVQRQVNLRQLEDQLDRAGGIPTAVFARALADATPTRSGLEDRVLREMRKRGHERPQTNVRVAGFEVDAFYPDRGLAVRSTARGTTRPPLRGAVTPASRPLWKPQATLSSASVRTRSTRS